MKRAKMNGNKAHNKIYYNTEFRRIMSFQQMIERKRSFQKREKL